MSSNLDEYEDLDDLLEDPSKLDDEPASASSTTAAKDECGSPRTTKTDPEIAGAMEDLQGEFAKLLQNSDAGSQEESKRTADGVNQLLKALAEAGSTEKEKEKSPSQQLNDDSRGRDRPNGFKDVVSNTLDRLKESGTKVDANLREERKKGNSNDDVLSQLLDQLVDGTADDDEEGMENAIQNMLNQMSSKDVLYKPMKEMQTEFVSWMAENADREEHADKIECYRKQVVLVDQIVATYERPDYEDGKFRSEIGSLLDGLEQLGDSPVSKGFNSADATGGPDLEKLLEVDGEQDMGNLDKQLQDACPQQ
ncbi:LADA_0H13674g1_1 [Lachancea dasiensis]|uniref:LADA_0H13674g1_1 n=1 Tax=Lachancea dasiensis TaxID=1072105 RepID=A0A1G4K4F1_9SACH|nr:LADA_0H13674g1_1 [Lachancea dasiensis]